MDPPATVTVSAGPQVRFAELPKVRVTDLGNDSNRDPLEDSGPGSVWKVCRKEITSAYYASIPFSRSQRHVNEDEAEFGWGGSARHFRLSRTISSPVKKNEPKDDDCPSSPTSTMSSPYSPTSEDGEMSFSTPTLEFSDMSINDTSSTFETESDDVEAQDEASREDLNWWKRILYKTFLHWKAQKAGKASVAEDDDDGDSNNDLVTVSSINEAELQHLRAEAESFLSARKERGSIFFDGRTAQIPLYAAPKSANMQAAPALSSFAPIAPLGSKAPPPSRLSVVPEVKGQRPAALAIATLDDQGQILGIRRNRSQSAWASAERFSRYIASIDLPPSSPTPSA